MRNVVAAAAIAALALAGCRPEAPAPTPMPGPVAGAAPEPRPGTATLSARISALDDAGATGAVVITEEDGRLIVAAALDGLPPGSYLLHVLDAADCGATSGEVAGGALGGFDADAVGQARFSAERADAAGAAEFVDRAVAVYARGEDGERGARVGCGVLRPMAR